MRKLFAGKFDLKIAGIFTLLLIFSACGKPDVQPRCIACNGQLVCDNGPEKDQLVCPVSIPIQRQI